MSHPTYDETEYFTTLFCRPNLFRFEFQNRAAFGFGDWQRYVIWATEGVTSSWWDLDPGVKLHPSVESSLNLAKGITKGVSLYLPTLLMPDMRSACQLDDLEDLHLVGCEAISGIDCYRLQGTIKNDAANPDISDMINLLYHRATGQHRERFSICPLNIWITQDSYFVCKIMETTNFETFSTESVIIFSPSFNNIVRDSDIILGDPKYNDQDSGLIAMMRCGRG